MDWPKLGDSLFRSDSEWQLNACVNCYRRTLGMIASCYKEGAEALAHAAADGSVTLDRAILPIVYLYRQYLELSIKDIINTARQIENEEEGYPKHHNLKDLWAEAIRLIRKHYGADTPAEIDHIQPCIDEFDLHDPESFAFRYPTDKKGHANLTGIAHINLRNLYETMERLSSFLNSLNCDLGRKLQWMNDMQSNSAG